MQWKLSNQLSIIYLPYAGSLLIHPFSITFPAKCDQNSIFYNMFYCPNEWQYLMKYHLRYLPLWQWKCVNKSATFNNGTVEVFIRSMKVIRFLYILQLFV